MKKRNLIIIIACVLIVAIGFWFFSGKSSKSKIQLVTEKVSRSSISNVVTATGTVEPVTSVEVGTQVSGIIAKIFVDYNSIVKKGEIIAEMDKETLLSELQSSQSTVASNKAELEYQTGNYNRIKTLHEKNLVSDSDYESALYSYEKSKSSYNSSLAALAKTKRNLSYATITSPIDGIVTSRAVEEGQTVAAGFSTPTLFTIANDLTQMRVIADIDESDIGQVEEGQKATFKVDAYPNDVFSGEVTQVRLEATVESNVTTYEVVISAPNPDLKLKPGLTATVTITTLERNNILTIPVKALRFNADATILEGLGITVKDNAPKEGETTSNNKSKTVWIKEGKSLTSKQITIGSTSGNSVEVTAGLNENEDVAVELSENAPQTEKSSTEQSPFMPKRPGSNKSK